MTQRNADAIIIGAGHNGLVCAAYLAQAGWDVLVLERSHRIGGGCVTEELVLCGSGTHPCGSVTGAPGHNAAQAILKKHATLRAS